MNHDQDLIRKISRLLALKSMVEKNRVAALTILHYHPRLDISPLLEWGLKCLPQFVEWITSALYYNARLNENYYEDEYDDYFWNFETKMMDAMYQFIRGVPNELEDL